jgi:hypothetical protein
MDSRGRVGIALVGALTVLAVALGCGKDEAFSKPAREIRVLYTNNGDGEIAPCG